jgi:flagellum-specific peptidoglycan hydrolase FlgJ
MTYQEKFLLKARDAAVHAGHIYPSIAACEAALESSWGLSRLATEANNLFGQKQSHPPISAETFTLPTKEFLHGTWQTIQANWAKFANWQECFSARMNLLRTLAPSYPAYKAALAATDPETFVIEVSKSWSTDPQRAAKVLSIYRAHKDVLESVSGN